MNPISYKATVINVLGNTFLFALKLAAGVLSGSIAMISEAINSFNDIVASVATFICVKISEKEADTGHPFGHSRAEPIAGLIIAVLAGILGFEIIRTSIERILTGTPPEITWFTLMVPVVTMAAKGVMGFYFKRTGKKVRSPALLATSTDSFLDVLVALAALVGIAGAWRGYHYLDPAAGFAISIWIIYTGYRIAIENIGYLMGEAPAPALLDDIKKAALSVDGVKAINTARAHFVGNFIHVEIHIEVDKHMSTFQSHAIGKEVERKINAIGSIEKAFIHIDPV